MERQVHKIDVGTNNRRKSQGPKGIWAQAEGGKWGRTGAGNGGIVRLAAWGAETSGGGWRVSVLYKFQVDNIQRRESIWGAGVQRVR